MSRTDLHRELDLFHPRVAVWFASRYGAPTSSQASAWPIIAQGGNVLVTAPTGSGKTLCAFLYALDRLLTGGWDLGQVRVLYVSPLRALGNDIQRNLLEPLAVLSQELEDSATPRRVVRVGVRTGDTSPGERRRQLRHPPEILITTPESLNILLTQVKGEALLRGVQAVIVDEVHALCNNRRGVHFITALERLEILCGPLQRIGLSATVSPLDDVAAWLGGRALVRTEAGDRVHLPRPVAIVDARAPKGYDLGIRVAETPTEADLRPERMPGSPSWLAVASAVVEHVRRNRSTLVFTQSRRNCERLARLVNEHAGEELVYSHHGSLSREIREEVERRLKGGELPGVVATSSLELGIDIGAVDEVVLVGSPGSAASAIQRIGRAGHGVGLVSRATLYPTHALDLVRGAVVMRLAQAGELEPLRLPRAPLDVLAQVLLSMLSTRTYSDEELFDGVRCAEPYAELSYEDFRGVLDMLMGKFASLSRSLSPRLDREPLTGLLRARRHVPRLIYQGGGTIPDRGSFKLRHAGTGALIGELDEEFVWERSLGDVLVFGVQGWRIEAIGSNDVRVLPAAGKTALPPFWRSDEEAASPFLAKRLGEFMEELDAQAQSGALESHLATSAGFDAAAARALSLALLSQRTRTGACLPHRHHVVIECLSDAVGAEHQGLTVYHTFFGGMVNRALLLALQSHVTAAHGIRMDGTCDDGSVLVELPDGLEPASLLAVVMSGDLPSLIAARLAGSPLFGAAFRRSAGRALLLPRAGFDKRTPLWLTRKRSQELLESLREEPRFPICLEAMRSVWAEDLSVEGLEERAAELDAGSLRVSVCRTSQPSPLCSEVIWRRTGAFMYSDDTPATMGGSTSLLGLSATQPQWRRPIPRPRADELNAKLRRTHPGYAPWDSAELATWLAERRFIPLAQWRELLRSMAQERQLSEDEIVFGLGHFAVGIEIQGELLGMAEPGAASEVSEALVSSESDRLDAFLEGALPYAGIEAIEQLALDYRVERERIDAALSRLSERGLAVTGLLTDDATELQVCTLANLERALRLARATSRPFLPVLPKQALPLFLAHHHGLGVTPPERLASRLGQLSGYAAPADAWESELLPARCPEYRGSFLDELFSAREVAWFGSDSTRLSLYHHGDAPAVLPVHRAEDDGDELLPRGPGRYTVDDLLELHGYAEVSGLLPNLWRLAFESRATADSFAAVRVGLHSQFGEVPVALARHGRRGGISAALRFPGAWQRLRAVAEPTTAIERAELSRHRAEILLRRYGVVFRELVDREFPWLSWPAVSQGLRLLELGGTATSGRFFDVSAGVQFASTEAVELLRHGLDEGRVYWMSGWDPACVRGRGGETEPAIRRGSHALYVYRGGAARAALTGKQLDLALSPEDAGLEPVLACLAQAVRASKRGGNVELDSINGRAAVTSPYRSALSVSFETDADHRRLSLRPSGKRGA